MVIKIQPPASGLNEVLNYNEQKAVGNEGIYDVQNEDGQSHAICTENVPQGSTIEDEFQRLRDKNLKTSRGRKLENPSFHMSVNPGEEDRKLTEREVVSLVREIMNALGYGKNPYKVFRHTDTGRVHYHVVSTRIGQDGKKVNDSFENKRLQKIMESLSEKYGFIIGNGESLKRKEAEETNDEGKAEKTAEKKPTSKKERKPGSKPFNLNSTEGAAEQFRRFHEEALEWKFSTTEQYCALLQWRYRTQATPTQTGFSFIGLDKDMKPCTNPVHERELEKHCMEEVSDALNRPMNKYQRKHVEEVCKECMSQSKSWEEYARKTEKLGVMTLVHRNSEGKPFGITYLDKVTRCIWKGSDTSTDFHWMLDEGARRGFGEIPEGNTLTKRKTTAKGKTSATWEKPNQQDTNGHRTWNDNRSILERLAYSKIASSNSRTKGGSTKAMDEDFLDTDKDNAPKIKI